MANQFYGTGYNYPSQDTSQMQGYYQNNNSGSQFQGNRTMQTQTFGNTGGMQIQKSYVPGRFVNGEQDILPGEVPTDGSYSVFIQGDLKRVYVKTLGEDGLIHTNVYQLESRQETSRPNPMADVLERLERIEQSLNNRQYRPKHKNNRNRNHNSNGEKGDQND